MAASGRPGVARVFTIDATLPFADALAAGLLQRHGERPEELADALVLLPTRRAARALREAFLRQSDGRALLLPRMAPIGDVEEDELLLGEPVGETVDAAIAPALDGMERLGYLTRLVLRRAELQGAAEWGVATPGQAAALAGELARLLDSLQIEGIGIGRLDSLVPERYADHWKLTREFLGILSQNWPDVLRERGAIDAAERRNVLLQRQADLWRRHPPAHPVIAAGSTGSIPATRALLAAIATLPRGAVVLPGLDRRLDEKQWQALDQTHAQYGLRELLAAFDVTREAVADWPAPGVTGGPAARMAMWSQALRPAADGALPDAVPAAALDGMVRLDCPTPHGEAVSIALVMRQALETRGRSAALVTADRGLARRVAVELQRWDIAVDDSAGVPLMDTAPATLLRLIAAALEAELAPVPLLALLQHPLCALGLERRELLARVRRLDRTILRGSRPEAGTAGLRRAIAARFDAEDAAAAADRAALSDIVDRLEAALAPLCEAMAQTTGDVPSLAAALARAGEVFAATDSSAGAQMLWRGDAGAAASALIAQLIGRGEAFGPVRGDLWPGLFDELARGFTVRPRYGLHPRLFIWGPLEARLQRADVMILGGLNEGSWPPLVDTGPWLTRPMREELGLPLPERRIGLAAHDFVQAACASVVYLTRAERAEGAPTVKARWLARLDALLGHNPQKAESVPADVAAGRQWLGWADALDRPQRVLQPGAPQPRPPLAARPRRLSVTAIETWRRDPYALYARHILRLRVLDPHDLDPTARERGTLMHDVLDAFLAECGGHVGPDAEAALLALGRTRFAQLLGRPAERAFWWPRFERVARWFVATQRERQGEGIALAATETSGEMVLQGPAGAFTVTAKADRIDRLRDATLEIIDYKTGNSPSVKEVAYGYAPQLPLEALIAGGRPGFAGRDGAVSGPVARLSYWRVRGTLKSGEIEDVLAEKAMAKEMADYAASGESVAETLLRLTRQSLLGRIARYDDPRTPYLSQPRPQFAGFGDYDHLARVKEWATSYDSN